MKSILLKVLKIQRRNFQRFAKMIPYGCPAHMAIEHVNLAMDKASEIIKGQGTIPTRDDGAQPELDF